MRLMLLTVSVLALAACGDKTPAAPAAVPAAEQPAAAPTPEAPSASVGIIPGEVAAKIAGTWRAIDDDKATITITTDGKWTDDYDDPAFTKQDPAPWRALTGAAAQLAAPSETFTPEATYIEVKRPEAAYYYELGDIDADNLEMFYVGRGNRLAYTRVK